MRSTGQGRSARRWRTATTVIVVAILAHATLMVTTAHASEPMVDQGAAAQAPSHVMPAGHGRHVAEKPARPAQEPAPDHRRDRTAPCGTALVVGRPAAPAVDPVPDATAAVSPAPDARPLASMPRLRTMRTAPPGTRRALLQIYRI